MFNCMLIDPESAQLLTQGFKMGNAETEQIDSIGTVIAQIIAQVASHTATISLTAGIDEVLATFVTASWQQTSRDDCMSGTS